MLYLFIGLLQHVTFRIYFKHIHVTNLKYIPYNKPVVIACNHPGAFMDPCLIGSMLHKPIYYTARGDLFKNPVASWFLTALHIKPVFRLEEGFENLSKNFKTIEMLSAILKKNGIVLIFSEGMSSLDRRLHPLRKGTAKIFMQIALENDLDIQLYASGMTYTHKKNFRKSVICSISKPLFLKDYLSDFTAHQQHAYRTFSKELAHRIAENFVVVNHPECDELVDQQINYYCNSEKLPPLPIVIHNGKKLALLQNVSNRINNLFKQDTPKFEQLQKNTNTYERALVENQISDYGLANKPLTSSQILRLIAALPFSIPGFYFWGLPYLIAKKIADTKVTRIDFYDSVLMTSLAFIFAIHVILNQILLSVFIGWWSFLIWLIAPVLGEFAFWTYDAIIHHQQVLKAQKCPTKGAIFNLRQKVHDF